MNDDKILKQEFVGFPDLEAAFEAVKGALFGPLDAGYVKHKFNEMVRDAKEKREFEQSPLGLMATMRDERDTRDRRDYQRLTLSALLGSNAAYRVAHEKAMAAFAAAGNAIDDAIEAGEKALADVNEKIEDYLASTPRLQDGRYVMFDAKDGRYKDQNFALIDEADLADVNREAVKPILPYERMMEWKERVSAELDKQRGHQEKIGEWQDEATNEKNPTKQDVLEERTESAADYEKDARDAQRMFENGPDISEPGAAMKEDLSGPSSIAVPPMP